MTKFGIIGCGAVTEIFHLPALKRAGIQPTVLVDVNESRVKNLTKKYGGNYALDYRKACNEADAFLVSTPHKTHYSIVKHLLEQKKHVLVEKPMASTYSECQELIQLAQKQHCVLAVGLFRRFIEQFQWIKEALRNHALGNIRECIVEEGAEYSWPVASDSFWKKELAGGGVLMDTGAHTLDLLVWLFDSLEVKGYYDDAQGGVECECVIEFLISNQQSKTTTPCKVTLTRSRLLKNQATLIGDKGRLTFSLVNNKLEAEPPSLLDTRFAGIDPHKLKKINHHDLFVLQIKDFLASIKSFIPPTVDGSKGAESVKIIDHCYQIRQPLTYNWETT